MHARKPLCAPDVLYRLALLVYGGYGDEALGVTVFKQTEQVALREQHVRRTCRRERLDRLRPGWCGMERGTHDGT